MIQFECPASYGIAGTAAAAARTSSTSIRAYSYRPIGGSNARIHAPINNQERLSADRRFRLERRQSDMRRQRVKFGASAPTLMVTRENPEPSTAPPPPHRRIQGLEALGAASSEALRRYGGLAALRRRRRCFLRQQQRGGTPGGAELLLLLRHARRRASAVGGLSAGASVGASSGASSGGGGNAATQAERDARREREEVFRAQAEALLGALRTRMVLAVETELGANGIVPVSDVSGEPSSGGSHHHRFGPGGGGAGKPSSPAGKSGGAGGTVSFGAASTGHGAGSHGPGSLPPSPERAERPAGGPPTSQTSYKPRGSGASGPMPPSTHLCPGANGDWIAQVLCRTAVRLSLPPGAQLWRAGDWASYVAFVVSGKLSSLPGYDFPTLPPGEVHADDDSEEEDEEMTTTSMRMRRLG